jgi:hypothetical protein
MCVREWGLCCVTVVVFFQQLVSQTPPLGYGQLHLRVLGNCHGLISACNMNGLADNCHDCVGMSCAISAHHHVQPIWAEVPVH